MQLPELLNDIKGFMFQNSSKEILGGNQFDLFLRVILESERLFFLMSKSDDKPELSKDFFQDVNKCLSLLKSIYFEFPLSKPFTCFVLNFLLLIKNLNDNTNKDGTVYVEISTLDRFYHNFLTSTEAIEIFKMLLNQLRRYQHYALPAIELSRMYLQSLDNKMEEKSVCKK
jgi:hypothetical protein